MFREQVRLRYLRHRKNNDSKQNNKKGTSRCCSLTLEQVMATALPQRQQRLCSCVIPLPCPGNEALQLGGQDFLCLHVKIHSHLTSVFCSSSQGLLHTDCYISSFFFFSLPFPFLSRSYLLLSSDFDFTQPLLSARC